MCEQDSDYSHTSTPTHFDILKTAPQFDLISFRVEKKQIQNTEINIRG